MEEFYWYWLCNIKGIGNEKIRKLIDIFETPNEIYHADTKLLHQIHILSERDVNAMIESKNDMFLTEQYLNLKKSGIHFISYQNPDYPKRLKNIYDSPYCLYWKGSLPSEDKPVVAIVGSRNCSQYGRKTAFEFAKQFAHMGIQVISGMANGIDAASHRGCLDGHGNTFAVLGCGVDICYPRNNIEIYMSMQEDGGIISEYCPGTQPFPGLFPQRNRIISGLADLVIVVEARKKSGSLITIDQALDQNRDVMVVPGRIDDLLSEGCNNLLKLGAQIITAPADVKEILSVSRLLNNNHNRNDFTCINNKYEAENNEKLVDNKINRLATEKNMLYSCLNLDPKSLDQIVKETKLSITIVSEILLELQIEGVIEEVSKNNYVRSYM